MEMIRVFCFFFILLDLAAGRAVILIGEGSGKKEMPLAKLEVECELMGPVLVKRHHFVFENDGRGWTEGEMVCPLGREERVVEFAMDVNGQKRDGVVVDAARARRAYEEIVARRVDPGLVEIDEGKGEFRMRVFPIPAKGRKEVWLTTCELVEEGSVRLDFERFGRAGEWRVGAQLTGGKVRWMRGDVSLKKEGKVHFLREGVHSHPPDVTINWQPEMVSLIHQEADEKWRVSFLAEPRQTPVAAKKFDLWWDGTIEANERVMRSLQDFLKWVGEGEIELSVFREEVTGHGLFAVKNGECDALLEALAGMKPHGLARPGFLPWSTQREPVILVTDGEYVEGKKGVLTGGFPLHVVPSHDSAEWLRKEAMISGGGYHRGEFDAWTNVDLPGGLEEMVMAGRDDYLMVAGRMMERDGQPCIVSPAAKWLWAHARSQELEVGNRAEAAEFNRRYKVASGRNSWIVLETLSDYLRYQIRPPSSEPDLLVQWEQRKKSEDEQEWRDHLISRWQQDHEKGDAKLCRRDQPFYHAVAQHLQKLAEVEGAKSHAEALRALAGRVKRLELLTGDELLQGVLKLQDELNVIYGKLENMTIAVGGQVRSPGLVALPLGSTIWDVIEAASGAKPFGAINRVKLYRNAKVYTYNLKRELHRALRVYPGDAVEVPEKQFWGDAQPAKETRKPGVDHREIELADWIPDEDFLMVMDGALEQGLEWENLYLKLRSRHERHFSFYKNFYHLLEKHGIKNGRVRLAREMAEASAGKAQEMAEAGRILMSLGENDLAVVLFERAVERAPDSRMFRYEYAGALSQLGQVEEAVKMYGRVIEMTEEMRVYDTLVIVALEEMNVLLRRHKLQAEAYGIDAGYVKKVEYDLRVKLRGNAAMWLKTPLMIHQSGIAGRNVGDFEILRHDVTIPGRYELIVEPRAQMEGGILVVEVTRDFGRENESTKTKVIHAPKERVKSVMDLILVP